MHTPRGPHQMIQAILASPWRHAFPWGAVSVVLVTLCFALYTYREFPRVAELDQMSLIFEALVAGMPAAGMFLIDRLRHDDRPAYLPLLCGLAALTLSMTTDALDEIVEMPGIYNLLFEGVFQVAGLGLVLLGLNVWTQQNRMLKAQLRALATTDFLTGCANRRHFMATIEAEMLRTQRSQRPLSLILFDIDHFKPINDRHGHATGDQILVAVSELVRSRLRATDMLARHGGEEFAVLAPETDLSGALALAEKCRLSLHGMHFGTVGEVTASFGVATQGANESVEALFKRADTALYKAKAAGRNGVFGASAATDASSPHESAS